ncbi:MAG: hypothetical protein F7B06_03235 [Opitutae bacterium]|nr:hypothetical protein [Opitutae bacterium]MBC9888867.1 hypothetical protein [Opitutae bacterium]
MRVFTLAVPILMGCATFANDPGRLLNLSNRAWVGVGHERLIGSAITTGDYPMKVLVVARGPSLADKMPADFTGNVLEDPMVTFLELPPESNGIQASNDNYRDWNDGEIEELFPEFIEHPNESGILLELPPGKSFSAIVEGAGGKTGLAQIEFYEIVQAPPENGIYLKYTPTLEQEVVLNHGSMVGFSEDIFGNQHLFFGDYAIGIGDPQYFYSYIGVNSDSQRLISEEILLTGDIIKGRSLNFSINDSSGKEVEFDLEYDQVLNEIHSSLDLVAGTWTAYGDDDVPVSTIEINSDGTIIDEDSDDCTVTGKVRILYPERNLFTVSFELEGSCSPSPGSFFGDAYFAVCGTINDCSAFRFQTIGSDDGETYHYFGGTYWRN